MNIKLSSEIIQCIVFFITSLIIAGATLYQISGFIWGAPTQPLQFVALLSCLGLMASSFVVLSKPNLGRDLVMIFLLGIGSFWLPTMLTLVPAYNTVFELNNFLCPLLYLILIGFVLLYPKPVKFGLIFYLGFICLIWGIFSWIYYQQYQYGEYAYPAIYKYRWLSGGTNLVITKNTFNITRDETVLINSHYKSHLLKPPFKKVTLIDDLTKEALIKHGICGTLVWLGGSNNNNNNNNNCILLIASSQPTTSPKLYNPRHGKIAYVYTGNKWLTIPANKATYPAFFTLERSKENSNMTMRVDYNWQGNRRLGMVSIFSPDDFNK